MVKKFLYIVGAVIIAALLIFLLFFDSINKVTNERTIIGTVTDKEVKRSDNSDKYLIYVETDNGVEVFEITDSLFAGRFDSSDLYGKVKVGVKYKFTICGKRIHILSVYPNLYEIEEIGDDNVAEN